jgi:alkylation response protein AidB-like acyl-CoA dehydrogenase
MSPVTAFTPDQEEIRTVARQFLEREAATQRTREWMAGDTAAVTNLWRQISELGWPGIAVDQDTGGAGYGFVERAILLEEMGRVLAPVPFLASSAIAADALALTASEASTALLTDLASGTRTAVLVAYGDLLAGGRPHGAVRADEASGAWTLDGAGGLVIDAADADVLLVVGEARGSLGLFAVEGAGPGVDRRPRTLVDQTRPAADVAFEAAPATLLAMGDDLDAILATIYARAAVSLAAEMIGGAQRCLDMTLAYVKDRQQFGVPIGSFQALKHRLADLHVLLDSTRELVYAAARVASNGAHADLPPIAAAAKAAANGAYLRAAEEAIQMHGGIGFTWEHEAHLFYKRALVSCALLGSTHQHLEQVAVAIGV